MTVYKRGALKIMHIRGGDVRIQEDTGDTIKVYSREEWEKEQEKRNKEAKNLDGQGRDEIAEKIRDRIHGTGRASTAAKPKDTKTTTSKPAKATAKKKATK